MKQIFNKIVVVITITGCLYIVSCKKKSDSAPGPATGAKVTVAGTSYSASTLISVPNDTALFAASSTYNPVVPSGGGYISYTFTDTVPDTIGGKIYKIPVYQYFFGQGNVITTGDTALFGFVLSSSSVIDTGTYTPSSLVKNVTGVYLAELSNFNDSASIGSVHITEFNSTSKTISGTYNLTIIGSSGSVPSTVSLTNGEFTNIPFQQF